MRAAETSDDLELLETEEMPRHVLMALAPALPEVAQPDARALPAIDSGPISRPMQVFEDASTCVFESMDWDEADPYVSVPDFEPERRPSLAVVQSAPIVPEDAEWALHRATPLPVPPRPRRPYAPWPPPRRAERAERPQVAVTHVPAWDSWDDWQREGRHEDAEDSISLQIEIEPRRRSVSPAAMLFNTGAFVLGFAATFLSGALTGSALTLVALVL